MDPTLLEKLYNAGPYGLCVILSFVCLGLYRGKEAVTDKLQELTDVFRKESLAGLKTNSEAVTDLTFTLKGAIDKSGERGDIQRSMQEQSIKTTQILASVAEALKELRADIRAFNDRGGRS